MQNQKETWESEMEGGPSKHAHTPSGVSPHHGSPYDINGTNFIPEKFIKKTTSVSLSSRFYYRHLICHW